MSEFGTYGNQSYSFSSVVFQKQETSSNTALDSGTDTASVSATDTSSVGPYPITAALGTLTAANYSFTFVNGTLTITQATPTLTWNTPASIVYGTALSITQLNASGSVPGAYVYTPAAGTVLAVGPHTLSVTYTPTDPSYAPITQTVPLTVTVDNLRNSAGGHFDLGTAAASGPGNIDGRNLMQRFFLIANGNTADSKRLWDEDFTNNNISPAKLPAQIAAIRASRFVRSF